MQVQFPQSVHIGFLLSQKLSLVQAASCTTVQRLVPCPAPSSKLASPLFSLFCPAAQSGALFRLLGPCLALSCVVKCMFRFWNRHVEI